MSHLIIALYVIVVSLAYGALALAERAAAASPLVLVFVVLVLAPVLAHTARRGGGP